MREACWSQRSAAGDLVIDSARGYGRLTDGFGIDQVGLTTDILIIVRHNGIGA
jgi:hypothetical protein